VISAGEDFPARVAQSLGRRFGVASLDHVQGPVKSLLGPPLTPSEGGAGEDWGRLKLLLIHQRLRIGSGLELTRQLIQQEHCPIPILVAGTEEDVALKRNRAIAAGAVDFISVDPFHVLSVMKAVGDTLAMFA
jgi:CheY-like chemotaxis protein